MMASLGWRKLKYANDIAWQYGLGHSLNCQAKKTICEGCPDKKVSRQKHVLTKKADLQRRPDKTL